MVLMTSALVGGLVLTWSCSVAGGTSGKDGDEVGSEFLRRADSIVL